MVKNRDLSNNPIIGTVGIVVSMFILAAGWVLVAGIVTAIATGDIHTLYPENLLKGILTALSSHF